MLLLCERAGKNEVGGVLMGYRSASDIVIVDVVGPGPAASLKPRRFVPDARWQNEEIARIYEDSGRIHTYLGDWHTHPGMLPYPSSRDKSTLKKIAESPESRAEEPVMLILGTGLEDRPCAAAYTLRSQELAHYFIKRYGKPI